MSLAERQALIELVEENVTRLAPDLAHTIYQLAAVQLTESLRRRSRPATLPAHVVDDIITPAIAATAMKLLAAEADCAADDWRRIYLTNRGEYFEREGVA